MAADEPDDLTDEAPVISFADYLRWIPGPYAQSLEKGEVDVAHVQTSEQAE